MKKYTAILLFIFISRGSNTSSQETPITSTSELTTTTIEEKKPKNVFEIPYKHTYLEFDNCSDI